MTSKLCFGFHVGRWNKQPTQNTKNKALKPPLKIFNQQPNSVILIVIYCFLFSGIQVLFKDLTFFTVLLRKLPILPLIFFNRAHEVCIKDGLCTSSSGIFFITFCLCSDMTRSRTCLSLTSTLTAWAFTLRHSPTTLSSKNRLSEACPSSWIPHFLQLQETQHWRVPRLCF